MTPGFYRFEPGKKLVELPEGHCGVLWVFRSRKARGSLEGARPSHAHHALPLWPAVLLGVALLCAAWWLGHGAP